MLKSLIKNISLLILFQCFAVSILFSQNEIRSFTLDEVIRIALDQSPRAIQSKHRFRSSYWQFKTYTAKRLPSLSFSAVAPSLNRQMLAVTQPDGTEEFRYQDQVTAYGNLSLSQNIPITGGTISINSFLQRNQNLADTTGMPAFYLSNPLTVELTQPLFAYNSLKWEKKIEPLKYEEAKKNYILELERISNTAVNYFFDLALAQINLEITQANYSNNDTLFQIARGRYNIGTIAQNELLQMELSFLNSDASLNQARLDYQVAQFRLRSFLGFNEKIDFKIFIPDTIPQFDVEFSTAIDKARQNNPEIIQFHRQLIEADQVVAQENWFNADLFASYGLTQSGNEIGNVYTELLDKQLLRFGVVVPILDWGLRKGRHKMAESNREFVQVSVDQALIDFEQNVFLKVAQFNMQSGQVDLAAKADTIATLRYSVTKQRFLIGKIDILDLNIASTEKDMAKRGYISSLRTYWNYFYTIRQLTLYDFDKNIQLSANYNDLLR